jgi:hypothetical protein
MPTDEIAAAILSIKDDLDQRHSENITRAEVTDRKVDEAIRRIDDLHKAFPGGDWEGHRRYHEVLIERIEKRTKLYDAMLEELTKKGMWALIIFIGAAVFYYIKGQLK